MGLVSGIFFHRADWLGGYAAWPRRMLRLAHVSCFGIGGLNLAFALTIGTAEGTAHWLASRLLLLALVGMPGVCCLAAWRPALRHAFAVPVLAVVVVAAIVLAGLGRP
jgi:hypothetical protein